MSFGKFSYFTGGWTEWKMSGNLGSNVFKENRTWQPDNSNFPDLTESRIKTCSGERLIYSNATK